MGKEHYGKNKGNEFFIKKREKGKWFLISMGNLTLWNRKNRFYTNG